MFYITPFGKFDFSALFQGLIVSGVMAILACLLRTISISGAVGGLIFGTIIYTATGWRGFIIPLAFFIIGTLATKHGYKKKNEMGIAQEEGGRRGAKHALANILAGTIFAVLASFFDSDIPNIFFVSAMVGSFATASADTTSSEMGQVYGKDPINPLTFRRVPPGTEGAVSIEGTLWGVLASVIIGIVSTATGFLGIIFLPAVIIGSFIGNMVESIIGSLGGKNINNEFLNFLNTLIGGLACGLLAIITAHLGFYILSAS